VPKKRRRWLAARVLRRAALGIAPSSLEQLVTLGDGRRHPGEARLSVRLPRLGAAGFDRVDRCRLVPVDRLPVIATAAACHGRAAVHGLRHPIDQSPMAFRAAAAALR